MNSVFAMWVLGSVFGWLLAGLVTHLLYPVWLERRRAKRERAFAAFLEEWGRHD